METQPAGQLGCVKVVIGVRWVSSGKFTLGCVHGDGQTPDVTVFSSSSKKVRFTVGSEVLHLPTVKTRRSASTPLTVLGTDDPRHTLKNDVTFGALSNQRAAYLRPRGSRWSPPPQSKPLCGAGNALKHPSGSAVVT